MDIQAFETKAARVAAVLKAVANQRRLMVLCRLIEAERATVGSLAEAVGLSQSALSQHLGVMRDEGLVTFDREGQQLWYRIADDRIHALFTTLYEIYCAPEDSGS
jgi:ArsR family transcriptional regulator